MSKTSVIRNIYLASLIITLFGGTCLAKPHKHKAAITNKDLLILMAACDLLQPAKIFDHPTVVLSDMCSQGKRLIKIGMSNPGPRPWTWQPGKMSDQHDFKYAGNAEIAPNLKEKKVSNISYDSAHFYSMWPLIFLSARDSSSARDHIFFQNAIEGLIRNLIENVVDYDKAECVVRYRNYIDGTNGVFRWNYDNRGKNFGHSAYSLSYTPFFSSLALLDDERIAKQYQTISACYPYTADERKKYFWSRGLEEERLLVSLSEKRPSEIHKNGVPSDFQINYYNRYFAKRVNTAKEITTEDAYASVVGDRMLVMHYSFYMNYLPWLNDFHAYAYKASQTICLSCKNNFRFLDELHLIYFLGRYLNLATAYQANDKSRLRVIFNIVVEKVENLYLVDQSEPVSTYGWDGVKIYNFKDYVNWKLAYYAQEENKQQ